MDTSSGRQLRRVIGFLIIAIMVASAFALGMRYQQVCFIPKPTKPLIETVTILQPVETIKETVKYVEYPVQVPVEIVKEVEKRQTLRHFDNVTELREWLAQDKVDRMLLSGYDCDDFAYKLQQHGARDGYYISTEIVGSGYFKHMINSVLIGNDIWFIEPQDDKFWLAMPRD